MFSVLKIFDKSFIVLRDDLLGEINGNKARKLDFLLDANLPYNHLICYGSSQSNAMQAIAVFAKNKGLKFSFVCARRCEIIGNLADALKNGANIYYSSDFGLSPAEFAMQLFKNDKNSFLISEGVSQDFARFGFYKMAKEIASACLEFNCDVFLPSGTFTSAIYLEKYLSLFAPNIRVFTTPCVSGDEYFKKQIVRLNPNSNLKLLKTKKKYHFAHLYEELFILTKSVENIDFELLYDSVGLMAIYENLDILKPNILYIHQGGLIGDTTMNKRYLEKYS